jgi:hypothetical protein
MFGSRFRAGFLLALVFAAGAAAGVAGDRLRLIPGVARASTAETADRERPAREPERRPRTTIERFADDLGLTAEQRAEIEEMLDSFRASSRALQQSIRPKYMALMDSVRTEIESVLNETQVQQYRQKLEEDRARRNGSAPRGDGSDGPGRAPDGGANDSNDERPGS